jgi:hypothetical protein
VPTLLGQLLPLFADTEEAVVKAAWTATGLVMAQIPKVKRNGFSYTRLAQPSRVALSSRWVVKMTVMADALRCDLGGGW